MENVVFVGTGWRYRRRTGLPNGGKKKKKKPYTANSIWHGLPRMARCFRERASSASVPKMLAFRPRETQRDGGTEKGTKKGTPSLRKGCDTYTRSSVYDHKALRFRPARRNMTRQGRSAMQQDDARNSRERTVHTYGTRTLRKGHLHIGGGISGFCLRTRVVSE